MTDSTDALIERCPLGGIELKLRIETFASETNEQINRKTKHKQRNGKTLTGRREEIDYFICPANARA